ncbi:VOC family protein [Myxosarcina sp. GI1]|uniref:VOC family protein n=1 Tax=Myxosarcina sp. GI1 TaxID=1541065 RepID=UPI0012E07F0B|nr:VOC family protein [Myxosarcina sp. GI1]
MTFSVTNLDEEIAQLKAKGIALVGSPCQYPEVEILQDGILSACFRDPDGNLIEFEQFLS